MCYLFKEQKLEQTKKNLYFFHLLLIYFLLSLELEIMAISLAGEAYLLKPSAGWIC